MKYVYTLQLSNFTSGYTSRKKPYAGKYMYRLLFIAMLFIKTGSQNNQTSGHLDGNRQVNVMDAPQASL